MPRLRLLNKTGLVVCAGLLGLIAACDDQLPTEETTALSCSDELDNDRDGLIDCDDPQCHDVVSCAATCEACDTAPASTCVDKTTLRSYQLPGSCEAGTCQYTHAEVPCPQGCKNGACLPSVCTGVICDQPPGQCFDPAGKCEGGSCSYDYADGATCDDGDACTTADSCSQGTCRGDPVVCEQAPVATCKDEKTLLTYDPQGSCSEGTCSYREHTIVCELGCNAQTASCEGDPCSGVTCNQPPSPCHQATGTCSAGACSYAYDDGKGCDDTDACTTVDTCSSGVCTGTSVACTTPPASKCQDGMTLRVYDAVGTCQGGTCSYAYQDVACGFGCDQATHKCLGDPCKNVTCNTPPSSCYQQQGSCSDGVCSYKPLAGTACDDGDGCTVGDSCSAGQCKGKPRSCLSPPKNVCADAQTLTVYTSPGSCQGGACQYTAAKVSCGFGCQDGVCNGDPCGGVVCDSPPNKQCYNALGLCNAGNCTYQPVAGACDDGDACTVQDSCSSGICSGTAKPCTTPPKNSCKGDVTLTVYNAKGTCSGGQCQYTSSDVNCPFGCDAANGVCYQDPCAGVTCTTPPGPSCADQTTRLLFSGPGKCSGGSCVYPTSKSPCNTPPKSTCKDSTTLTSYAQTGACKGGQCGYDSADTKCEFGCSAGACKPDPCAGVSCTTPPATSCLDASTRLLYGKLGKCSAGKCEYPTKQAPCNTPPKSVCKDAKTLIAYAAKGSCSGGQCAYKSGEVACSWGCNANLGQCNPDPCAGVSCTTPPATTCFDETTQLLYSKQGKCSLGKCAYPTKTAPCTAPPKPSCKDSTTRLVYASKGRCQSGNCIYATKQDTCTAPPANYCIDTKTLAAYAKQGKCGLDASGAAVCNYPSAKIPCVNGFCKAGKCQLLVIQPPF